MMSDPFSHSITFQLKFGTTFVVSPRAISKKLKSLQCCLMLASLKLHTVDLF